MRGLQESPRPNWSFCPVSWVNWANFDDVQLQKEEYLPDMGWREDPSVANYSPVIVKPSPTASELPGDKREPALRIGDDGGGTL